MALSCWSLYLGSMLSRKWASADSTNLRLDICFTSATAVGTSYSFLFSLSFWISKNLFDLVCHQNTTFIGGLFTSTSKLLADKHKRGVKKKKTKTKIGRGSTLSLLRVKAALPVLGLDGGDGASAATSEVPSSSSTTSVSVAVAGAAAATAASLRVDFREAMGRHLLRE